MDPWSKMSLVAGGLGVAGGERNQREPEERTSQGAQGLWTSNASSVMTKEGEIVTSKG